MNREETPGHQPDKSNSFGEDSGPENPSGHGPDDYQRTSPVYDDDPEPDQPGPEPSGNVPNEGRRRQRPPIDAQIYEQPGDYQQEEGRLPRPRHNRPIGSNGHSGPAPPRYPGAGLQTSGGRETEHRGSPVYDEYFDLMAEVEGSNPKGPELDFLPLDLNLMASLVRWASIAKLRVGPQRLGEILDLYFQSGHSSPGLQALLNQVAGMADEAPAESDSTSQLCVDLMAHLHGILTGGLPSIKMA